MNKRPWQRLLLSLLGIVVVWITWRVAVEELKGFPIQGIAAFTTITTSCLYAVMAIVIFMVTGRLVYEWKMNTVQQISEAGEQLIREDRTPAPKHFDDDSIQ